MSNKYFVVPGIFEKQKPTDLTIAIPVRVFAVETIERDVQDNFISSSIKQLRDLGLSISEISNTLSIDGVLVKQFLDSIKEEQETDKNASKEIKNVAYMFYDKHSNTLANGFVSSKDYQSGLQKVSIVEDNGKIIRMKEKISSSTIYDVFVLPKNKEASTYELTQKDVESNVLVGNSSHQKILDCYISDYEDNVYVITKIYFCEKNVNRFFVYDYYGQYHDNYTLYKLINSSLNENEGLRAKIENNKRSFLKNYKEKLTKSTNNDLRREFDVQALKKHVDLYNSINTTYFKYVELIRAKNNSSRNVEELIFELATVVYGCYEKAFRDFIADQYDDSSFNRFNELLEPNDDRVVANRKVHSFIENNYSFVINNQNEKAIKMIDGYEALLKTINDIVSDDSEFINVFNLLFISLIIADDNPKYSGLFLRFSAKNPLFLSSLLQLKKMRDEKKHTGVITKINDLYLFVIKMFNSLVNMIHFMFDINKGDQHVIENSEEEGTQIRIRADINDTLKLEISNKEFYGIFMSEVSTIEKCFETKEIGSNVLEASYNAMAKICSLLLKIAIEKYEYIESEIYTDPNEIDNTNKKISSLGSLGVFDKNDFKKKTITIREDNAQEQAYKKYAFASVIGFLANNETNFMAFVFEKMPNLISLYNLFIKDRGHNNIVDEQHCDEFYAERFEDYQEFIKYLQEAAKLENIKL